VTAPTLSVVVPAYDEARRLGPTLARITKFLAGRGAGHELIVVDDGSTDTTAEVARAAGAQVLVHRHNRGKGAAVRTGVLAATGARILICDADLSTAIEELTRLEAALDAGADVAIASRHAAAARIEVAQPWPRRVLGAGFRNLVRAVTGVRVRDPMCGFKLLTRAAAHDLLGRGRIERFAYDVELLYLARDRWRVDEVAVTWRHVGGSRVVVGRDAVQAVADLIAIRMRPRS